MFPFLSSSFFFSSFAAFPGVSFPTGLGWMKASSETLAKNRSLNLESFIPIASDGEC